MSLTKEALQHLEASHKTATPVADGSAIVVGQEFKLADLEKYQDQRRRFRGEFKTEGLTDFTRYLSDRAEAKTPVFIDRDYMAARCFLDIGVLGEPGHCEHIASLVLPQTPAFKAFRCADGNTYDQDSLVELLEDWGHCLSFENSKGEKLEFGKVINAVRKVSIDDLTKVESDKQDYSSQVGVMNSVKVNNAERLPAVIRWSLQTHRELDEQLLDMRVSMLTSKGDTPRFRLRAVALESVLEEAAQEFATRIGDALPECECLVGTFQP